MAGTRPLKIKLVFCPARARLASLGLGLALFWSGAAGAAGLENLIVHPTPKPPASARAATFEDEKGQTLSLEAFQRQNPRAYVLVNFWATWCAPCREEMPSLDRLARAMEREGLIVLAIAQERASAETLRRFYDEVKLTKLAIFRDPFLRVGRGMGATGLPVTVLLNPQGQEVARLLGPADWASPAAQTRLRALMK